MVGIASADSGADLGGGTSYEADTVSDEARNRYILAGQQKAGTINETVAFYTDNHDIIWFRRNTCSEE
jgi:hypothetical protein